MSLRAIGGRLFKHGASILRQAQRGKPAGKPTTRKISNISKPVEQVSTPVQKSDFLRNNRYHVFRNIGIQVSQRAKRVLIDDVLNRVSRSSECGVFKGISQRGLYGNSGPVLALVGFAVVGQGLLTKDEELEGVCWEIRECMSKIQSNRDSRTQHPSSDDSPLTVKSFVFGKPIAKGANAVVYSVNYASEAENLRQGSQFPLALKMMFNYDIQSNSLAILKAMYRETVPATVYYNRHGITDYEYEFLNRTRHLPAHPNIVKILSVFTDFIPELEQCREMYPAALPKRIDPEGEGRNMSLFILMNKYHQNLQEYIASSPNLPLRTSALLLTQLLEGVVHMVANNIAHRDIKADNILLELSDPKSPLAVISDFGCCLADKSTDLVVPYTSFDIEKGGNTALMAPEIISKKPGPFSRLNYLKSDMWAVGALGYEVFGAPNPFYGNRNTRLLSSTYKDEDLPSLPSSVPGLFNRLVKNLLRRDPSDRLSPEIAANVCQLFLWAPNSWLDENTKFPNYEEILEWVLNLAAKILCEAGNFKEGNKLTCVEYLVISTFLCRVKLQRVREALEWVRHGGV
ncbi:serine/threonine-protein kinase Pink1, mitochondrial [Anthonomus grandis grandis]|uniref:serine/threonine-protein kinase Pink1, mitochondrial n=1 Tax=Anthonomus grandis grandis TaxID=2921223 RepID=UPI0021665B93|nr:serine/threonine-protein kinase Pink1, mitochondrial [Anthonomus grandis grandis]XP_050316246.1 serine/threonine-protein kinase Pink1, mitochondrial [Anthonomus grandis grandis]